MVYLPLVMYTLFSTEPKVIMTTHIIAPKKKAKRKKREADCTQKLHADEP